MSTAKAVAAEANLHKSAFSRFDCRRQGVARQGKETTSKEGRLLMTTALAHVQRHVRHYNMQHCHLQLVPLCVAQSDIR